ALEPEAAPQEAAPLPAPSGIETAASAGSGEAAAEAEALVAPEVEEPETAPAPSQAPPPALRRIGFGLRKTREAFMARLRAALGGGAQREQMYEELEEALIGADVGIEASGRIIQAVREK